MSRTRMGLRVFATIHGLPQDAYDALNEDGAFAPFDEVEYDGRTLELAAEDSPSPTEVGADVLGAPDGLVAALDARLAPDGWGGVDVIDHAADTITRFALEYGQPVLVKAVSIDNVLENTK